MKRVYTQVVTDRNTTIGGILQFLAILSGELQLLFDDDALTNPDYNWLVASAAIMFSLFRAADGKCKHKEE